MPQRSVPKPGHGSRCVHTHGCARQARPRAHSAPGSHPARGSSLCGVPRGPLCRRGLSLGASRPRSLAGVCAGRGVLRPDPPTEPCYGDRRQGQLGAGVGAPVVGSDVGWQQSHVGRRCRAHLPAGEARPVWLPRHPWPGGPIPGRRGRATTKHLPAHSPSSSSESTNVRR